METAMAKPKKDASSTETINYAPKKLVLGLIRGINEDKTRVQSINGARGEEIKGCVEDKHLHSGALKAVAKLVRMDPEKRDDFLRAHAKYYEYAKEAGLFGDEHVGDLVDDTADGESRAGVVSLGNVVAENVKRLGVGIKQIEDSESLSA
jgi:hypothetical protein